MNIPNDTTGSNGIKVQLSEPPIDESTFTFNFKVPLYIWWGVRTNASLPEKLILTNASGAAVSGVSGSITVEMRNANDDRREFANRISVQATGANAGSVTFSTDYQALDTNAMGSMNRFTVNRAIGAGETFEIDLKYLVGSSSYLSSFSTVPAQVFVRADCAGGYSEREGRVRMVA